jgi:hypothetical protein
MKRTADHHWDRLVFALIHSRVLWRELLKSTETPAPIRAMAAEASERITQSLKHRESRNEKGEQHGNDECSTRTRSQAFSRQ